jgi:hypothetical protein
MESKDKAKELINRFSNVALLDDYEAKQCAIIAVDEILNQCLDYRDIDLCRSYNYWQEVKREIEKL